MLISSGVSSTCLFAPAAYYKLNKGFFLGFLFKSLGGLRPPCGLNKKASEKYSLFITCSMVIAGFQVGPTFPVFPTFPYFFDLLLLFPTFSWKCPTIPTFSLSNVIYA